MKRALWLLALLSTAALAAEVETYPVAPDLWDRPRTARAILAHEPIRSAAGAALARPDSRLVIRHGGDPESALNADELKSWLGALAIDTRRIALASDPATGARVRIEIVQ